VTGGPFGDELARVAAQVEAQGGLYGVPWYLVVGEPLTGKSAVVKAMNLTLAGPPLEGAYCHYWIAREAVLVEARQPLVGPSKNSELLQTLARSLAELRPREPLDGILLVVGATDVVEREGEALEAHAQQLRSYLVDVCRELAADVPVYVVVNRYDTLWGFAEVFAWSPERAREEGWGLLVPATVQPSTVWPSVEAGLAGVSSRIEATCLALLSSEQLVEPRIRAYQHLVEARVFVDKLGQVLKILAFQSAYERAPWLRAVVFGCAVPGIGDRIRAGIEKFNGMGLAQNPYDPHRAQRPGGLPLFAFFRGIVLPERDLVPKKTRWRDDLVTVVGLVFGVVLLLVALVLSLVAKPSG
jgi:type VI protein secretion system component VasK